VRRGTLLALAAQLSTGVFTTVVTLYLVRALGPEGFGVFSLALGIGGLVLLLAEAGIPASAARFLAEARGDANAAASALADALQLQLAASVVLAGVLFGLAGPIADAFDEPDLVWPLRGIAVAVLAQAVFSLYLAAFQALRSIGVNLRLVIVESTAEAVATIALVAAGAGATGAAFGRAAGYAVGVAAGIVLAARLLGRRSLRPGHLDRARARSIGRYALPLLVTNGAYTLYARVDVLVIGALLGTPAVGIFSAASRLTVPLGYVGQSFAQSVAPRQARSAAGDDRDVGAFTASLRLLVLVQGLVVAVIVAWAEPIVRLLFGDDYAESATVLRWLAPYIFLHAISPLISVTVNYLGQASRRIPIVVGALVVNVVLDLILVPAIGVEGAAIGTSVAYALYVPAHYRVAQRELGLSARPLVLTLVRTLLAGVVAAAVLVALGTHSLTLADWIAEREPPIQPQQHRHDPGEGEHVAKDRHDA
jgi:O-antigen/teichoic acid export membrane protein